MKRSVFFLALLFLMLPSQAVHAQFEGQINFSIQNPLESPNQATLLGMTFTRDRIFLETNNDMDVMTGLSAKGVLVRNDHQDFIFMTGDDEAVKIEKKDIDNLVNLLNRVAGRSTESEKAAFDWEKHVSETGNSRTIHGYTASEFVLHQEDENRTVSIWLTDEIKVHWGLLDEAWNTTGRHQLEEEIPIELIMNRNSFPLLIEAFEDNQRVLVAKAESVSQQVDRSKTEVASGIKLLGFGDLMMQMFRQRR
jgi:hypothetical protein